MNPEQPDEALLALLPWYVTGQVAADEREQIDQLLQRSAQARQELERLQRLAEAVRAEETVLSAEQMAPAELGWARLQRSLHSETAARSLRRDRWRPVLAVAAALILALQLSILLRPALPEPDWQLQSSQAVQPLAGGYRVQVRFVEHAQWQNIRAALGDIDALWVDGPSALGVVQLQIPANRRFADGQALLTHLKAQSVIQFAALLGQAP